MNKIVVITAGISNASENNLSPVSLFKAIPFLFSTFTTLSPLRHQDFTQVKNINRFYKSRTLFSAEVRRPPSKGTA